MTRYRYKEYDAEDGPWEPFSGAASALMGTISGMMMGIADVPMDIFKAASRKTTKSDAKSSSQGTANQSNDSRTMSTDSLTETTSNASGPSGNTPTPQRDSPMSSNLSKADSSSEIESKPSRGVTLGDAIGAGKGIGRVVDAGFKSPMDFTLSLAKGFHNAPRLYGDTSVRPHEHITGFQSGLKAAGKVWVLSHTLNY